MAKKEKACLNCKRVYEGDRCPNCNETAPSETIKGRVHIFNPEESQIAKNMNVKNKGEFAIKTK